MERLTSRSPGINVLDAVMKSVRVSDAAQFEFVKWVEIKKALLSATV